MNRDQIIEALKQQLDDKVFRHTLAVEACMGGIYDYLEKEGRITDKEAPREDWQIAGLLHDIDYSGEFKEDHPNKTQEALDKYGLSVNETIMHMVKSHAPDLTGVHPESLGDWALFCMDSLTGLIMAVGYVYPSRKLADVKAKSVKKRFHKEPKFAAGTRRTEVAQCENPEGLNIPVDTFIEICLDAMKDVAEDIGL